MKILNQEETNANLKPNLRSLLDSLEVGESLCFTKAEWDEHWDSHPRALIGMTMGSGKFSTQESKDGMSWVIKKL